MKSCPMELLGALVSQLEALKKMLAGVNFSRHSFSVYAAAPEAERREQGLEWHELALIVGILTLWGLIIRHFILTVEKLTWGGYAAPYMREEEVEAREAVPHLFLDLTPEVRRRQTMHLSPFSPATPRSNSATSAVVAALTPQKGRFRHTSEDPDSLFPNPIHTHLHAERARPMMSKSVSMDHSSPVHLKRQIRRLMLDNRGTSTTNSSLRSTTHRGRSSLIPGGPFVELIERGLPSIARQASHEDRRKRIGLSRQGAICWKELSKEDKFKLHVEDEPIRSRTPLISKNSNVTYRTTQSSLAIGSLNECEEEDVSPIGDLAVDPPIAQPSPDGFTTPFSPRRSESHRHSDRILRELTPLDDTTARPMTSMEVRADRLFLGKATTDIRRAPSIRPPKAAGKPLRSRFADLISRSLRTPVASRRQSELRRQSVTDSLHSQ